jgi:hypothetical protein
VEPVLNMTIGPSVGLLGPVGKDGKPKWDKREIKTTDTIKAPVHRKPCGCKRSRTEGRQ